ncbi:hypothetical protein Dda_1163 [Drechslerella dactyloides]|uniref:Uncharacterized protein n=1 Tax=Drechslerella dactyloides TaxID=74499 RepID=A0AAD6J5P7_DREDA|nr:hypothetical protein Dda_1163 [Drechslerella dactyloides]
MKSATHHSSGSSMPLWQLVGLIVMASILLGSPLLACLVYHRRREQEHMQTEVRKAFVSAGSADPDSAQTLRARYQTPGRDHYVLPFPVDVAVPPTPRRTVSGSSTVPLLMLSPEAGPSRQVSGAYAYGPGGNSGITMATGAAAHARERETSGGSDDIPRLDSDSYKRERGRGRVRGHANTRETSTALGVDFAERAGTATALAYPETAHRAPQRERQRRVYGAAIGGYGTLGHVMHSTYTAAQRAYRGRHRLNFWSAWMAPWLRGYPGLAAIDEESVGTSRLSRERRRNGRVEIDANAARTTVTSRLRDFGLTLGRNIHGTGSSVASSSAATSTSGFSLSESVGTPPAFEKFDGTAPYNPSMARSLTRRLLKVGFQAKDGVEDNIKEEVAPKGLFGAWKGCADLKRRVLERRQLEGGPRLFSIPKRRATVSGSESGSDDEGSIDNEEQGGMGELAEARTSIRDFAHAFSRDIVGESTTGTVRVYHIDDPGDDTDEADDEDSEDDESDPTSETARSLSRKASATSYISDENTPTTSLAVTANPDGSKADEVSPAGTLRGRRTIRGISEAPGSQKMRMERNTPQSTGSRVALAVAAAGNAAAEKETNGTTNYGRDDEVD